MTYLDRLNALCCGYIESLAAKVSLPGVEIIFTGFKAAQGNLFVVGQLCAWPLESGKIPAIDAKTTLYHTCVPSLIPLEGGKKYTRYSAIELTIPEAEPHFTGREAAWEFQKALKEQFDELVAFIRENPAEWMSKQS